MTRVLVVDDEIDTLNLLRTILEISGYEPFTTLNSVDAIILAEVERPDCVLLDIMMPQLDGFTLCKMMRQHPETANLPIVFVTAYSSLDLEDRRKEAGADMVLPKPIGMTALVTAIEKAMGMRAKSPELAPTFDQTSAATPAAGTPVAADASHESVPAPATAASTPEAAKGPEVAKTPEAPVTPATPVAPSVPEVVTSTSPAEASGDGKSPVTPPEAPKPPVEVPAAAKPDGAPVVPVVPVVPAVPAAPAAPVAPVAPVAPAAPAVPAPAAPVVSGTSSDPLVVPATPAAPATPAVPTVPDTSPGPAEKSKE